MQDETQFGNVTYEPGGEDFVDCPALVGLPLPVRRIVEVAFGVADSPGRRDAAGEDAGGGAIAIVAGGALATVAGASSAYAGLS